MVASMKIITQRYIPDDIIFVYFFDMKVYRVLVEKPEGKRPHGKPRHRWEDGIRIDVR
jgi:hypothetical protein